MMIVAIDPGIRGSGVAVFQKSLLVQAMYVKNPINKGSGAGPVIALGEAIADAVEASRPLWDAGRVWGVVSEWPQIYTRTRSKGDPNDLLALAAVPAAVAGYLDADARSYLPREWKGQMTKKACAARAKRRLSIEEQRKIVSVGKKDENTWDAIGVGLFHLGRFAPLKVIAR